MNDWRERMARIEAERENNWARQLRELDGALDAVLNPEQASGELSASEAKALREAKAVVTELRRIW